MNRSFSHLRQWLGSEASLPFTVGLTAFGLVLAYLLKVQCVVNPWADNFQYSHLCYNDIQPLFGVRGISLGLLPYRDVEFEYPVLTGMFMDLAGRVLRGLVRLGIGSNSDTSYFQITTVLLAPFAFGTALLLRSSVTRARLMLFAVGTPTILYSFHNWDLIAVMFLAWGLVCLDRQRHAPMGSLWAVGASAKLFPAFLMPGAVLGRWAEADRKGAVRLVAAFAAVYALINVPWIVIAHGLSPVFDNPAWPDLAGNVSLRQPDTNGWLGVWLFHAERYPDFGTVWYWIAHHAKSLFPQAGGGNCGIGSCWWDPGQAGYRDFVSVLSFLLFVAGSAWSWLAGWQRRNGPEGYPVAGVGLSVLAFFLLTSKVNSPQFTLWLVPLLCLLNVRWRYIWAYLATDLAVYVSGFYWFTVFNSPAPAWKGIFEVAVLARAAALAVIAWGGVRAIRERPQSPEPVGPSPASPGGDEGYSSDAVPS